MLDREQDKAINEARRRLTEAPNANAPRGQGQGPIDNIIPDHKGDYVAGIVAQHAPELHRILKGKDPDADYDVIKGQVLKWATTQDLQYPADVQTILLGRLLELLGQDKGQPNPYPHSSWRT
jgi:hypothetical protein